MKTVAIIQARMGSTRLPGKVLLPILGQPMLSVLIERVQKARHIDQIVVATSLHSQDTPIADLVDGMSGVSLHRGSEEDVLGRYFEAATRYQADRILRVTADNPLFDPPTADALIQLLDEPCDYASNSLERSFPYGIDLEAFTMNALGIAHGQASRPYDREHVTPYIQERPELFALRHYKLAADYSHIRVTVDTPADYEKIQSLFEWFGKDIRYTDLITC